jgi:hypothetical protein
MTIWVLVLAVTAAAATDSLAQVSESPPQEGESAPIHWAYSSTFGTGVYGLQDTRVFVLNLRIRYPLLKRETHKIGLTLLFPLTIGVHDFDIEDIFEGRIPDQAQTLTFVPGVQVVFPVGNRWVLRPTVELGGGWELQGHEQALIYTIGLDALYDFSWKRTGFCWMNGLSWHGYTPNQGNSDDFIRLSIGLDVNQPLGVKVFKRDLMLKPHTIFRWYIDDQELALYDFSTVLEVGLGFGLDPHIKVLWFKIERIGLAYKISNNSRLSGIRLLLGLPF